MSRSPAPPPTSDPAAERAGERIAKLLARAGIASRREVERMIAEGRVARDGALVDTPATLLRSLAGVTVDGQPVAAPAPARLFLYHKPVGLLVTERDPAGRPTIYDRLPDGLPRVVPVGRLDLATEGLLLLTTDGGLKRQLELPSTGVERTYRARAYGEVSQAMLEELIEGVEIDGIRYGSIDANLERRTGANTWIEMTLTEGKNREVRRVLEHLGLQVGRLIRTRYGPFVLADLAPGEVGEVRQHDLIAFRQLLGGRPQAASTLPVVVVPVTVAPSRAVESGNARAARAPKAAPDRKHAGGIADSDARRTAPMASGRSAGTGRGRMEGGSGDKAQDRGERDTPPAGGRKSAPADRRSGASAPRPLRSMRSAAGPEPSERGRTSSQAAGPRRSGQVSGGGERSRHARAGRDGEIDRGERRARPEGARSVRPPVAGGAGKPHRSPDRASDTGRNSSLGVNRQGGQRDGKAGTPLGAGKPAAGSKHRGGSARTGPPITRPARGGGDAPASRPGAKPPRRGPPRRPR